MTGHLIFLALAAATIGVLPSLLTGAARVALAMWVLGVPLALGVAYLATPETVTPFFGIFGFMVFSAWSAATMLTGLGMVEPGGAPVANGTCAFALMAVFGVATLWGSPVLNAPDFAALAGKLETRDWTADVQPKDPRHMRLLSAEMARYVARKAVSQDGAVGSQFSLGEGTIAPQVVGGRLTYVIPLEPNGVGAWWSSEGSPGWVQVDAEDPAMEPRFVKAPAPMRVMEGAYLGDDLERVARMAGIDDEIVSTRFRLDAKGAPHWLLSLGHPLHVNSGVVLDGVAVIDPVTGAVERHPMDALPDFVDIAYPHELVNQYLAYRGDLSGGWWNSVFAGAGLTKPEATRLVAGNGDGIVWVTGMTSSSAKDDSLVSLVYVDPRTGHGTTYVTKGGGTESAALKAADANQDIVLHRLTATMPQVYNVDGIQTVVMPLVNGVDGYSGVAFCEITDVNEVAWGPDVATAADAYRAMLARKGRGVDLGDSADRVDVEGAVDRIAPVPGGRDYQFDLVGSPQMYVASSVGSPRLVLTRPGDAVSFRTTPPGPEVMPAMGFANVTMGGAGKAAARPDR